MRSPIVTLLSLLLMGFGYLSIVFVSSALISAAQSQQQIQPPTEAPIPAEMANPNPVTNLESNEPSDDQYVPSMINTEGYVYDPSGRRDPFKPSLPQLNAGGQEGVISADPLQTFDLGQYKLVAIVWDVKNPRAMVKDPQGKTFTIKNQTKIGRNNGFVSMIREGAVLVVEPTIAENGMQTAATRVMLLGQ